MAGELRACVVVGYFPVTGRKKMPNPSHLRETSRVFFCFVSLGLQNCKVFKIETNNIFFESLCDSHVIDQRE